MKNIFIKSTIILMCGTFISKLIGFIIRILFARIIKDGISIYALIMPTYSLLITITQLGLPYAISSIMARNNYRGIHIFSSIIPIAILFNIFVITCVFYFAPFLANNLLKNPDTYYPIISITIILPFTTLSGIIKGYFFGKQNMLPNAISSIFEQITRLILLVSIIPILMKKSIVVAVSGYVIISSVSELVQIIVYLFFLPKNVLISLSDLKIKGKINKDIFSISIPSVSKGLIGNISYFFEPIILTNVLLYLGYSSSFIAHEYGIYNTYVIPLLIAPTFFTMALNTCLIPEISKNYNNKEKIKSTLKNTLYISFLIGVVYCLIVFFKGDLILKYIYRTNEGFNYLKILAIFFPLFYLEGPLTSTLQGLNYSKFTMNVTLITCIIKLIILTILSFLSIGIYSLVISEIIDIILVLLLHYRKLHKYQYI